jgi:soluble lytic murein transglycosylase-like protein
MLRTSVVLLVLFLSASVASSDVYKYVDENGVTCYTDAPFGKKSEKTAIRSNSSQTVKTNTPNRNFVAADYHYYVQQAADKYEIEPELIHAVIRTESNGNHRAVSKKGAMGLMQLMPATANDLNVTNPFNPEENIDGGTRYLKYLIEKFNGNLTLALAAYNSGPTNVEKYGNVPPFTETRQYVNKVYSLYSGRKNYNVSVASSHREERSAPIVKVVLDDGTILFTNSTLEKKGNLRF